MQYNSPSIPPSPPSLDLEWWYFCTVGNRASLVAMRDAVSPGLVTQARAALLPRGCVRAMDTYRFAVLAVYGVAAAKVVKYYFDFFKDLGRIIIFRAGWALQESVLYSIYFF